MNASEIIATAETTLLDPGHQYWTVPELVGYINEAQRLIAELKTDAVTVTAAHTLKAGARQQIPADGVLLVDVMRNLGLSGIKSGPSITPVDQRKLDRMVPDWQGRTHATVEHYMYDDRERTTFYVYPAQPNAASQVEIRYVRRPAEVESETDELTLGSNYFAPVLNYVLYRAHSKTTQAAVPQRAQAHYQLFLNELGVSNQAAQSVSAGEPDQTGGLR